MIVILIEIRKEKATTRLTGDLKAFRTFTLALFVLYIITISKGRREHLERANNEDSKHLLYHKYTTILV